MLTLLFSRGGVIYPKKFETQIFGPEKFWVQKNLWSKTIWGPKKLGSKKIHGSKEFGVQNNFGSKKFGV